MRKQPFLKPGCRGQAALEYLVTYGWAFIVVLVTIGAFAYFGVLSPTNYLPERCNFGSQLICADYILESDPSGTLPGKVRIKFSNGYGVPIKILDINTATGNGMFCEDNEEVIECDPGYEISIDEGAISGDAIGLSLENTDYFLVTGEKMLIPIMVNFSRDEVGAPVHVVYGEVFAEVQEGTVY